MKKITLFALAALTASSTFAAVPQVGAVQSKSSKHILNKGFAKETTLVKSDKSVSRAEDATTSTATPSTLPTYRTYDALYLGFSRDFHYKTSPFGFVPAGANVTFYSFSEADSYSWAWTEFTRTDDIEHNSSEKNLTIQTTPFLQFSGPTLEMTSGAETVSYNDSTATYFSGGTPSIYSEYFDGYGVTPVLHTDDGFRSYYTAVSYAPADAANMNENGTFNNFANGIAKKYKGYTDFKLTGWGSILPGSVKPFLLKGGYIYMSYSTKEAVELPIAVMSITEDGKINRADTIGVGSMLLSAGNVNGQPVVEFEVSAVDKVLGLSTGQPIVVPSTGVYISISGINNPEVITSIDAYVNASTCLQMDIEDYDTNPIYDYIIDWDAVVEFDCKDAEGNDVQGLSSYTPLYELTTGSGKLNGICEYLMFYDVEYPYLANMTEGFVPGDMTIEIPVEGGTDNRYFEASTDLIQLIDDEYVTVDVAGDTEWFTFDTEPEADYPNVFNLIVESEALPVGTEGRKATITFSGNGFDNTITLVQGTPASIKDVVAAKAKDGKVYDLQGRAVKNAGKGIYIVDGKKVIL